MPFASGVVLICFGILFLVFSFSCVLGITLTRVKVLYKENV